jgi:hypothetical protein
VLREELAEVAQLRVMEVEPVLREAEEQEHQEAEEQEHLAVELGHLVLQALGQQVAAGRQLADYSRHRQLSCRMQQKLCRQPIYWR